MSPLPATATVHPWNTGFTWALPADPPRTITAGQKAQFDRDGFLVLPDVVDRDTLDRLTGELDELEAKVERFLAKQDGGRMNIAEAGAITFTLHAVLRSEAAHSFARHPALIGLCGDLVGSDVNLYWDQAVYKKPEKPRRFPWHQDTGYTFVEPQNYLTCWVALTDATVDNGCPWIVPGAHIGGTLLHRWVDPIGWECFAEAPDAVPAEVAAGGVVAFSSLTPHLTRPNTTGAVRKAYIVQYAQAGTQVIDGDWAGGGDPVGTTACDDQERQFPVLRDGIPVL